VCVHVCEGVCVCVFVRERDWVCMCDKRGVCSKECVCVRVCAWVCLRVHVWVGVGVLGW